MTTYEHFMLGASGTLSCGLYKKQGWQIALFAGVVSVLPDWDGLTILFSSQAFAEGHRVWGHNVLMILIGLVIGLLEYRYDFLSRVANKVIKTRAGTWFYSELKKLSNPGVEDQNRQGGYALLKLRKHQRLSGYVIWGAVGFAAIFFHLVADMVVSGTDQLADWKLKLFWPFSDQGYVYPMIPWGDPGMSIIFVIGMLAGCKYPARIQLIATITLTAVVAYIVI